jgi:tetratricopeptide (TPR) repeat protein
MYITRYLGDPRKALPLADRLTTLDPLEGVNYTRRADVLMALRRYPEVIQSARKSLELNPNRSYPHQLMGDALTLMNRPAEARAEYEKAPADDVFRLAGEAILEARSGNKTAMERTLTHMRELFSDAATYNYAQVYAQAHELDRTFATLARAQQVKDPGLTGLRTDPFLDPIRTDPRYEALLQRLNFPPAS